MGCLTEAWSDNMKLLAVLSLALLGVVMAEPGYGRGYYGGYGHGHGLSYGYGHGYHGYGKRSADADAEPTAVAEPGYRYGGYGYGGYGHIGYGGYGGYRGYGKSLLMLKQAMDLAMDMAMEVMAMEAMEAMVIDMARGLLMLDMAMDTVGYHHGYGHGYGHGFGYHG